MRTARGIVGVIGLDGDGTGPLLTQDQRRLLDALTDQAALSVERVNLAEDLDRARLLAETERLRAALLTSLSHDLRTPLAAILGAASSLATYGDALDPAGRREMLRTIEDEAERLNRFVANLLDMTRLESGAVALKREPTDLGEVIGTTLSRAARVLDPGRVSLELAPDLPLLDLDPVLFEQVLFNLLDNAAKYAPAGSAVTVRAWRDGGTVKVQVLDSGPGIPPGQEERIFEKFFRVHAADRQRPGTGLGLAVCRGFVEAMGGGIVAANRPGGPGAVFTITLPVPPTLSVSA
jgi:two-component system sensor histidine kinase KdpD